MFFLRNFNSVKEKNLFGETSLGFFSRMRVWFSIRIRLRVIRTRRRLKKAELIERREFKALLGMLTRLIKFGFKNLIQGASPDCFFYQAQKKKKWRILERGGEHSTENSKYHTNTDFLLAFQKTHCSAQRVHAYERVEKKKNWCYFQPNFGQRLNSAALPIGGFTFTRLYVEYSF